MISKVNVINNRGVQGVDYYHYVSYFGREVKDELRDKYPLLGRVS